MLSGMEISVFSASSASSGVLGFFLDAGRAQRVELFCDLSRRNVVREDRLEAYSVMFLFWLPPDFGKSLKSNIVIAFFTGGFGSRRYP